MADFIASLQHDPMPPPPLDLPAPTTRRGSETSPSRSSFQSSNASRIHTPSTSIPSTPITATRPASPEKRVSRPGESDALLTAVATQERRVLELKEDLQKAEVDLAKLKKQWAAHEAKKKRNESRNTEQLQPLKTSFAEYPAMRDENAISACKEMDRRKTLSSSAKLPQRKVFSGSRHTRTLSLLSTNASKVEPHYPPREDSLNKTHKGSIEVVEAVPELDLAESPFERMNDPSKSSDRDLIIETGKQLVGDFRQGFWTFVEDLKQVTVGDESSPVGGAGILAKSNTNESKKVVARSGNVSSVGNAAGKQKRAAAARSGETMKPCRGNDEVTDKDGNAFSKSPQRLLHGLILSTDSDGEAWETWDTSGPPTSTPPKEMTNDQHPLGPIHDVAVP